MRSGALRAESFYAAALKATEPAPFHSIRLQILLRMAFRFTHEQEVKAKGAYEEALVLAESMSTRPKFYGNILVSFAELHERMGHPEEAAKLRGRAVSEPASEPLPSPRFGMREKAANSHRPIWPQT
jgi:hypothetical protein